MIRAAKGFRMRRSKLYRYASDAVDHGRQYAYRTAALRSAPSGPCGRSASTRQRARLGPLTAASWKDSRRPRWRSNRKILADIAATDAPAFNELVKIALDALKTKAAKA
jgi:large subunit ribosomal protein L20